MNALIGVVIGGAISLFATIVTDMLRARRDRQHLIATEMLDRMSEFVAAGHEVIGDLHDRGAELAKTGPTSEEFLAAKSRARDSVDRLRVARASALMINPRRRKDIREFMLGVDELRDLADEGFDKSSEDWERMKAELPARLETITNHVMSDISEA